MNTVSLSLEDAKFVHDVLRIHSATILQTQIKEARDNSKIMLSPLYDVQISLSIMDKLSEQGVK